MLVKQTPSYRFLQNMFFSQKIKKIRMRPCVRKLLFFFKKKTTFHLNNEFFDQTQNVYKGSILPDFVRATWLITPFQTQFVTLNFEIEEKCIQFEIQLNSKINLNFGNSFEQSEQKSTELSSILTL